MRYSQPAEPEHDPDDDRPPALGSPNEPQDAPRSIRPGQAGFASRLMSKYGWTKGTGLGADESGIVNPLRVQVEKRRKKADADGGGWAEPGGKGKIIGGKRKEDSGRFGTMSEVIVLRNMLENMADLQGEIAEGLGQEIGEECGEKVSSTLSLAISNLGASKKTDRRIVRSSGEAIHRPGQPPGLHQVHRPSVSTTGRAASCGLLRMFSTANMLGQAVNELDGRIFNGNTIAPKFYNLESFEKGVYI